MVSPATIEYTGNLGETDSWLVLTNFASPGEVTHVIDPADLNVVTQRFYRMNLHD